MKGKLQMKSLVWLVLPIVILLSYGLLINAETSRSIVEKIQESRTMPLIGQYLALEGIEAVYQLPSPLDSVQGVLFVAHGCSHSATDWWPRSTSCTKCTGLPVEMSIVREALYENKFAVLAISSMNRIHKCWGPKDIPRVHETIKYFYSNIIPGKNVSFHALGASSGGGFVGFLSQQKSDVPVSSICVQISSVGGDRVANMPPTLFILMSRDDHTLNHVKSTANSITKSHILVTSPKEIKSDYFYIKSNKFITLEESRLIQSALVSDKLLDEKFMLIDDPRVTNWRETIKRLAPSILDTKDTLIADQSTVSELLNLAWNMHEITDEYLPEVFSWFKKNKSDGGASS